MGTGRGKGRGSVRVVCPEASYPPLPPDPALQDGKERGQGSGPLWNTCVQSATNNRTGLSGALLEKIGQFELAFKSVVVYTLIIHKGNEY